MTTTAEPKLKEGRVVAIAGPVVDVEFPPDGIPEINNALEVALHIGDGMVRAISLQPTDGLVRGAQVTDTGDTIEGRDDDLFAARVSDN